MVKINYDKNTFININDKFQLTNINIENNNYVHNSDYLVSIIKDGFHLFPISAELINDREVEIKFKENIFLNIEIKKYEDFLTLTVVNFSDNIDNIIWGPISTTFSDEVRDTIGIVENDTHSFGMMPTSINNIQGWPTIYPDLHPYSNEMKTPIKASYLSNYVNEVRCAKMTEFGSVLQCFSTNFNKDYKIKCFDKEVNCSPNASQRVSMKGSQVAIFLCEKDNLLDQIEKVVLATNLPYPTLNGEWIKKSNLANQSYIIIEFTENNIEECVKIVKESGCKYMYHPEPFETWGYFPMRKDHFPNGDAGFKKCVDIAKANGLEVGIHTLSNFTKTDDKIVVDEVENLAFNNYGHILETISKDDTNIVCKMDGFIDIDGILCTVRVGKEIIKYESFKLEDGNIVLKNCERGMYNTIATSHAAKSEIYKLMDHGYNTLYPNFETSKKYSDRLNYIFRELGVNQTSFDGVEGLEASKLDQVGVNIFVNDCLENLSSNFISDASRCNSYTWHHHQRFNWGEPWGARFKEGMVQERFTNIRFFESNLIPKMLGWYLLRLSTRKFEATTIENVEWMLSQAAGLDAGFTLFVTKEAQKDMANSYILQIMKKIQKWEELRLANKFPQELRDKFVNQSGSWNLVDDGDVTTIHKLEYTNPFVVDSFELQPGQKGGADLYVVNSHIEQPLNITLRAFDGQNDGVIKKPYIKINNETIFFETTMNNRDYIYFDEEKNCFVHTDQNFNLIKTFDDQKVPTIPQGTPSFYFGAEFSGEIPPYAEFNIILKSESYKIGDGL